jgi:hypothetical protein
MLPEITFNCNLASFFISMSRSTIALSTYVFLYTLSNYDGLLRIKDIYVEKKQYEKIMTQKLLSTATLQVFSSL